MNSIERKEHEARRLKETERWASFVKDHSNPEWSNLQADLIDSQLNNAARMGLTRKQVEDLKTPHS